MSDQSGRAQRLLLKDLYYIAFEGEESPIETDARLVVEEAERQKEEAEREENDWSNHDAFLYVLPKDMTPKELVTFFDDHGIISTSLDNCQKAFDDETKALILKLRNASDNTSKPFPVLWHSIVYHPEVEAAREKHFVTGEFLNPALAREQLGSLHRWNPYLCKQNDDSELDGDPRARLVALMPHQRFQVNGPELPSTFHANDGVWVIGKTVASERTSARRR